MDDEPAGVATAQAVAFPFMTAMNELAEQCRRRAQEAIASGDAAKAKEWLEAAGAAHRASAPAPAPIFQQPALQPIPPPTSTAPLGKDQRCSYCGGALWVCRGNHSIC